MASFLAYLISIILMIFCWISRSTTKQQQLLLAKTNYFVNKWCHWLFEFFTRTKITYIHPAATTAIVHPPSHRHAVKKEKKKPKTTTTTTTGEKEEEEEQGGREEHYVCYELTAMDCLQASIPPIAFSLFYNQPIDVVKFQRALERTLIYFPLLAGRIYRQTTNVQQSPFLVKVAMNAHNQQQQQYQRHKHNNNNNYYYYKGKGGGENNDSSTGGGGALFITNRILKPYPTKGDRRWFPIGTAKGPWPSPHEPFILGYGPLLRIKHTYVESTNSSVLSYGFCHVLMDATSVGSFLQTLKAHYNSNNNNNNINSTTARETGNETEATTSTSKLVPEMSLERVFFKYSSSSSTGGASSIVVPKPKSPTARTPPPTTTTTAKAEPLDRFTKFTLIKSLPKLLNSALGMKHINLTITKTELQRLKKVFLNALLLEMSEKEEDDEDAAQGRGSSLSSSSDNNNNNNNKSKWVSTYEMLGVILLRAFYLSSKEELLVMQDEEQRQTSPRGAAASTAKECLECRCIVDPRGRDANPYVNSKHQGNVSEMPSLFLPYKHLQPQQQQQQQNDDNDNNNRWQKLALQDFHNQLRTALKDPNQMQFILRSSQASYDRGYLHTTEGRTMSSKIFARNITEPNVCSYNSWLHMDWFDITSLGGINDGATDTANGANNVAAITNNKPIHFQVSEGMNCQDMFWVFPRTPDDVTIRTTLSPAKAKKFLKELHRMDVSFEVQ